MSVLVRGMDMPKDCPYCPMSHWSALNFFEGCEVTKKHFSQEELDSSERPDFCPLIPVPEHGDLIDREALLKYAGNCYDSENHLLYAVGTGTILLMPTIIPAEKGEG